mmetsp:Transcript_30671/g.61383  ORF Transcript_30671/g.61383 Transcript_30671/m.61383 type:complete len:223 (+) Transcript_30671:771-1439(+)
MLVLLRRHQCFRLPGGFQGGELLLKARVGTLHIDARLRDLASVLPVPCDGGFSGLHLMRHLHALVGELHDAPNHFRRLHHFRVPLHGNLGRVGRHQSCGLRGLPLPPLLLQRPLGLVHLPPHALRRLHHLGLQLLDFGQQLAVVQPRLPELLLELVVGFFQLGRLVPEHRLRLVLAVDFGRGLRRGLVEDADLLPLRLGLQPQLVKRFLQVGVGVVAVLKSV